MRLAHLGLALVQDSELVATELVTNAYLHAAGPRAYRLLLPPGRAVVRFEVDDASPHLLPRLRGGGGPGGRGLLLIRAIGGRWGVLGATTRKTIWAELPLPVEFTGWTPEGALPPICGF